jgi:hypothetical protein
VLIPAGVSLSGPAPNCSNERPLDGHRKDGKDDSVGRIHRTTWFALPGLKWREQLTISQGHGVRDEPGADRNKSAEPEAQRICQFARELPSASSVGSTVHNPIWSIR